MSSQALRGAHRLTKTKHVFAHHTIPLECDVYSAEDYPATSPVFLYFHSGGLVTGSRSCVPPWLAQEQMASGASSNAVERKVIVGGGSAGFFMASLTAHHFTPSPIALLSVTGITTFRHRFFNSSVLLTPEPIAESQMSHHLAAAVSVGTTSANNPQVFHLDKLLPDGTKNANFDVTTVPITEDGNTDEFPRGCLYDYYLYRNEFPGLVGDIDPGYEWAKAASAKDKVAAWPPTTIIQGNSDEDVDLAVSTHMVGCLGEDKAKLFLAEGQPHRYEATRFLEDDVDGMDAVRQAVSNLEADVARVA
ncbi:Lipase 2 [Colletotrichum sp. SAR11_240]|nr:Lipase 2 [Colletotrichum sp. SAR11_240]